MTTYGKDALDGVMFPVREVAVFAESEPGRFIRFPPNKALVNEWSGDVVSIVGNQYQVLHNSTALELGVMGCVAAFPETSADAWKVTRVHAAKTGGYCVLDLRYRPNAKPLVYDWEFVPGRFEQYEPYFQVANGYNGRSAFSLRFGVIRLVCKNGLIARQSVKLTKVAHDRPDMVASIERAIQATDFTQQADRIKSQLGRLWQIEIPHQQFAPVIQAILRFRRPKRMDEKTRSAWRELQHVVKEKGDRYVAELGPTAYALMAALTDLATTPPAGRPFIFREPHSLQQVAGVWMDDFASRADQPDFDLAEYVRELSANGGSR